MVATDVYRPAAIEQLVALGERVSVPVFEMGTGKKPAAIAAAGLAKARTEGFDAVIVDTAGRTQARMSTRDAPTTPCWGVAERKGIDIPIRSTQMTRSAGRAAGAPP